MSFNKFLIYCPSLLPQDLINFSINEAKLITSEQIMNLLIELLESGMPYVDLKKNSPSLKGKIIINFESESIINFIYRGNKKINIKLKKDLLLRRKLKHNPELCMFLSLIESDILMQYTSRKKLVLMSYFVKKTTASNVYSIYLYLPKIAKNHLTSTFSDCYIDCSRRDWKELVTSIVNSSPTNEFKRNNFKLKDYKKFFDKNHKPMSISIVRDYVHNKIDELYGDSNLVFDKFDLEIQSIIASTWLKKKELIPTRDKLNTKIINTIIKDQLSVILNRYNSYKNAIPVFDLLKPKGIFKSKTRYWHHKGFHFVVPVNNGFVVKSKSIEIEFKEVTPCVAQAYEECFHYIHNRRKFSLALGLFIKGEKFPYAVSLLDLLSLRKKDFKIKMLQQAGINQEQCVDEIRLYSFPWAPMMTSSLLAELVRKELIKNYPNILFSITAVNRNLFEGKYIIQSNYRPLGLKPTHFKHKEIRIKKRLIKYYQGSEGITDRESFQDLLPTIEYFRPIKKNIELKIPKNKVMYITEDDID